MHVFIGRASLEVHDPKGQRKYVEFQQIVTDIMIKHCLLISELYKSKKSCVIGSSCVMKLCNLGMWECWVCKNVSLVML